MVSGSQYVLEICWNSKDLGFPPGMELNFPFGIACPAPAFGGWGDMVNPCSSKVLLGALKDYRTSFGTEWSVVYPEILDLKKKLREAADSRLR